MHDPNDGTQQRDGVREWLIARGQDNPINLDIAEEFGDFPSRNAAATWLSRQEATGVLPVVGMMKDSKGRKVVKVHCKNWKPKEDNLFHEITGTRIRLLFPDFECERGYRLNECLPDLLMRNGNYTYEYEIDCLSLKRQKYEWRCKRHSCQNDILVVVASKTGDGERRLQQLINWSESLGDRGFFTTLQRLQNEGPFARVWDYRGRGNNPLKRVKSPVSSPFPNAGNDTAQPTGTQEDKDEVCDKD